METVKVSNSFYNKIRDLKNSSLQYEELFSFERQVGITNEIGEVLLCFLFDLELIKNNRNAGFDAYDPIKRKRVEIKSLRKKPHDENAKIEMQRTSKFSYHEFDYCYFIFFNKQYQPVRLFKAEFVVLKPFIEKGKKRSMTVREIKNVAHEVEIPQSKIWDWDN